MSDQLSTPSHAALGEAATAAAGPLLQWPCHAASTHARLTRDGLLPAFPITQAGAGPGQLNDPPDPEEIRLQGVDTLHGRSIDMVVVARRAFGPAPPPALPPNSVCYEACSWSSDGECDDGAENSVGDSCPQHGRNGRLGGAMAGHRWPLLPMLRPHQTQRFRRV